MSILTTKLMGLCFWSHGLCVQRLRFEGQVQTHNATMMAAAELAKAKGDTFAQAAANDAYEVGMDEDFITALEYGMPPTAGMVRIWSQSQKLIQFVLFQVIQSSHSHS